MRNWFLFCMVATGCWRCQILFVRFQAKTFRHEWTADIRDKERYVTYRCFKNLVEVERYLSDIDIFRFRVALTQLRLGVLPINDNTYRYSDCPTHRNCVFCPDVVENEDHFLLVCPLYTDLRKRFLEQKGAQSLQDMLQWKDTKRRLLLSKFTFHAMNRRKLYI